VVEAVVGVFPFAELEAVVEARGAASERDAVVEVAVLKRAEGLAAVVELVVEGRVAIDEAPTTEGLGLIGVVVFGAGAPGRAEATERMLLVDEASVDLRSAGFAAVTPGRAEVAVVPVERFAKPFADFFSSPEVNVPGPS